MGAIRSMYDGSRNGSDDVVFDPKSEAGRSKVKAAFAGECDINVIMRRAIKSGVMPVDVLDREPVFGDFSDIGDFHAVQNRLIACQESFLTLPADVRERFDNDPAKLLAFVSDVANKDEAVKLGLIEAPAPLNEGQGAKGADNTAPAVPAPPSGGAA